MLYLLEANVYLLLFYGIYALLLQHEPHFQANRAYLLCSSAAAWGLPLVSWQWLLGNNSLPILSNSSVVFAPIVIGIKQHIPFSFWAGNIAANVIWLLYIIGILATALRLGLQLKNTLQLFAQYKGQYCRLANGVYIAEQTQVPTCSFGRYILLNTSTINTAAEREQILQHEQIHALQNHSADLLWAQLLGIVAWFNPISYCYKRALQNTHEYIADRAALAISQSPAQYGRLIIAQMIVDVRTHRSIVHTFSNHQIKNRLTMLQHKNNKQYGQIRYFALPFFIAICLLSIACSKEFIDKQMNNVAIPQWKDIAADYKGRDLNEIGTELGNEFVLFNNDIIGIDLNGDGKYGDLNLAAATQANTTPDKAPEFKGGTEALINYLASNMLYPDDARKKGIGGMVFVGCHIDENGKVVNVHLKKGVYPSLDAEAMRVISTLPNWIPATKDGKPVKEGVTLPIKFALE